MKRNVSGVLFNSVLLAVLIFLPSMIGNFEPIQRVCIHLIVAILLCCYIFIQLRNMNLFSPRYQEPIWKNVLLLAPVLIVFISFPLFLVARPEGTISYLFDPTMFFLNLLEVVFVSLLQEMLFRMYFFYQIKHENRLMIIIISAAIFAAFDILLFFEGYSFTMVLWHMLQSFLLGLILGAIMEYGHCIYLCMAFRIAFEFIYEQQCCGLLYNFYASLYLWIFLLLAVGYLVVLYFVHLKKKEYYDVQ